MSRITRPAPYGHHLKDLADGHQLCARCGRILLGGETVEVVYRGDRGTWRGYVCPAGPDWYGIYTHPEGPNCPPAAVSGWQAIWRATEMREADGSTSTQKRDRGKRAGREAMPVTLKEFVFFFVSLLDDAQCRVEMRAVTVSGPEILDSDRIKMESRNDGREADTDDDIAENERFGARHAYVEDAYIRALDGETKRLAVHGGNRFAAELVRAVSSKPILRQPETRILTARTLARTLSRIRTRRTLDGPLGHYADRLNCVMKHERANLHVNACDVRESRDGIFAFYFPTETTRGKKLVYEMEAPEKQKTSLKAVTQGSVLTSDSVGRPVEYALYCRMAIRHGERGDKKIWLEHRTLDELRFYLLSGPKAKALLLKFDSIRFPELFDWFDAPTDLVEHWPRNPQIRAYGRPARLKQSAETRT